jgi:16S rRNA C967 or C1407 C5-methylase (RsmB/RsmF family)/NOL1/NOP2/fmu family ribosome biogenesis protein
MLPEGFIKRIRTQKYIDADGLVKSLQEPSPASIRINRTKWSKIPYDSVPVPWCSDGYHLGTRPSFTFDPLFHSGCYYPQEASGMFLEQVFDQVADRSGYLRVLDLCGAPGGKSTHLSSLIGDGNLLVSNEVIRSRALILAENITKWGIPNTLVTQNDPSDFGRLNDFFDIILVDAPCSGEGMFRDPVAINEWSESVAFHCSERQKRILADVWPALKPGGTLIYSTCTFNPSENEENVEWLFRHHQAKPVDIDVSRYDCITKIEFSGIKGLGFYPDKLKGEGLFISAVRKDGGQKGKHFVKSSVRNELKKQDIDMIREWTLFREENIVRKDGNIFSVPGQADDFHLLDRNLRIVKPGTGICKVKKNGYVPSHDLALSTELKNEAFYSLQADYDLAIEFLRKNPVRIQRIPSGYFIIKYNGVNLGFCNNIGSRINNYYPVGWRIRMRDQGDMNTKLIDWHD